MRPTVHELAPPVTTAARELGRGLALLALAGSSVGGLAGAVALAARALGR
jgi:hypothetical protein